MKTTRPFDPNIATVGFGNSYFARQTRPDRWSTHQPVAPQFLHPWKVTWRTSDSVHVAPGLYHKFSHSNDTPFADHVVSLQAEIGLNEGTDGVNITDIEADVWILLKVTYEMNEETLWAPVHSDEETATGDQAEMFCRIWTPDTLEVIKWNPAVDEDGEIPINSTSIQYFKIAYVTFDIDVGSVVRIQQKLFQHISLYPVIMTYATGGWD